VWILVQAKEQDYSSRDTIDCSWHVLGRCAAQAAILMLSGGRSSWGKSGRRRSLEFGMLSFPVMGVYEKKSACPLHADEMADTELWTRTCIAVVAISRAKLLPEIVSGLITLGVVPDIS
jgi:hypothetical protein